MLTIAVEWVYRTLSHMAPLIKNCLKRNYVCFLIKKDNNLICKLMMVNARLLIVGNMYPLFSAPLVNNLTNHKHPKFPWGSIVLLGRFHATIPISFDTHLSTCSIVSGPVYNKGYHLTSD